MPRPRERDPGDKIKRRPGKRPKPFSRRRVTGKLREALARTSRRERDPNAAVEAEERAERYAGDAASIAVNAAGRGLDKARRVLREERAGHVPQGQDVEDVPPERPAEARRPPARDASPPGESGKREVMGKAGKERERTVRDIPTAEAGPRPEAEIPSEPPSAFAPRERRAAPKEKTAQVLHAREKPTETIVASRPQAKKEEISPRPPSPGDRMRREAMRTRQTADGVPRGGELERPFPPAPVEVPEEQRSGPIPTGNDIGPRTVRPVKEAPRDSLDFSAPDDPSPLPSPSPEIYAGGRPRATDSPAVSERPQAGLRTIRERPRPDAGPREKRPATAAAPKTRRETDRMIRMAGGRGSETAKAWERSATLPAPKTTRAARAAARAAARGTAGRTAQARARQPADSRAQRAAKATVGLSKKAAAGAVKAAASLVSALVGLAGGAALLLPLCVIVLAAAVVASPFGIFLAGQELDPGSVPPNGAISQVNIALTDYLAELQDGEYSEILLQGQLPDWREVLAVFAVQTTFSEDGVDVVTLDPDRVERLKAVFWDMTAITTETEEGEDSGEVTLRIIVEARTAGEMREVYGFTDDQNAALDELLAEEALLEGLISDLSVSQADAAALLEALPEDLDPARRAVVETACSLVGKVNYFWGGKSLVLGWDDRWGSLRKVTAEGSPTSGTYRPYGMDCSGFVDWVFYNATGGEYVIGQGGGAAAQHDACTPILWSEAQPGDLVFYPEDVHVGIVGGRDEDGRLLIIHCASGYNNTVITGLEGFTAIARPRCFVG